ncbi:MAG: hypothetical protein IT552_12275 [Sphingomonadaceae bacterium]|nr:hypothetical protein [Sphingomonadaceae bacterium]
MLTMILAAQAMIAAPVSVQQNADSPACAATPFAVSLNPESGIPVVPPFGWSVAAQEQALRISGKVGEVQEKPFDPDGRLPSTNPENRDPAQALPECRNEPPKRRKRKSDYPMA